MALLLTNFSEEWSKTSIFIEKGEEGRKEEDKETEKKNHFTRTTTKFFKEERRNNSMCDYAAKRTIDQLVNNFGFSRQRSEEAVRAIANKGDVQLACDWLLDHGEEDKGGAVTLIVCDHFDAAVQEKLAPIKQLKFGEKCVDCGNEGENWVCLFCASTRCSRYCQSHGLKHWEETKEREEAATPIASLAAGACPPLGHFLSLSLMDLSVWCYECKGMLMLFSFPYCIYLFIFCPLFVSFLTSLLSLCHQPRFEGTS